MANLAENSKKINKKTKAAIDDVFNIAVQQETYGEQVVNGIINYVVYIFCYDKESRELYKQRAKTITDAFDRQFPE